MVFPKEQPLDESLYETLAKLQGIQQQRPKVALYIESWCRSRQKTIDLIPTLRDTVKSICSNCSAGREVGAAVSLGGLLTAVVGAILKWKGFPVGNQFLEGGKYLTATGTVVLATSNLAEACLTQSPTNRIKEVIDKDIKLTEPIRKWLNLSHEVEYCFDKLLQCNVASPVLPKVMKVLNDCISLLNAGSYEINNLIQDLRCCKVKGIGNVTIDVSIEVIRFLVRIRDNPNIRKPLKEICEFACDSPGLIGFVNVGMKLYFQACGITPSLPFDLKSLNRFGGAFDVIKMLYDLVTNIKFAEIEKRQTAYFEALERVTLALKSELKEVRHCLRTTMRDHYDALSDEIDQLKLARQSQKDYF